MSCKVRWEQLLILLEYLVLELFLIAATGFSFIWGYKGIFISSVLVTTVNIFNNYLFDYLFWEVIIFTYAFIGVAIKFFLDRKTNNLRVVKVTAGSAASLFFSGIFLPLILGMVIWSLLIGIPLTFSYRDMPSSAFLQIIFKFIFCSGWIIIGNILY